MKQKKPWVLLKTLKMSLFHSSVTVSYDRDTANWQQNLITEALQSFYYLHLRFSYCDTAGAAHMWGTEKLAWVAIW